MEDPTLVSFVVEPSCDGWRLDRYLCHKLPRLSRNRAQWLIRQRLVADRVLKPGTLVRAGLAFSLRHEGQAVAPPPPLVVLHADEAVVVVDKPAGVPMHPTARYRRGTLACLLRERFGPECEAAHRLDLETSGVLVCALGSAHRRRVGEAFAAGQVDKTYLALVEGHPPQDAFVVDAPIAEGTALVRVAVRIDPAGKPARTAFEVVRRFGPPDTPLALVRAHPETGRQHQLRVHLAHAGHPIVGDKIYGPDPLYFDRHSRGALEAEAMERLRLPRQALHAWRTRFPHPLTGAAVSCEAPLPEDLAAFVARHDR